MTWSAAKGAPKSLPDQVVNQLFVSGFDDVNNRPVIERGCNGLIVDPIQSFDLFVDLPLGVGHGLEIEIITHHLPKYRVIGTAVRRLRRRSKSQIVHLHVRQQVFDIASRKSC